MSSPDPASTLNAAIYQQFRDSHQPHQPHAALNHTRTSTGVIWTTERANEYGYSNPSERSQWANLGQGAPEVDDGDSLFSPPLPTTLNVRLRYPRLLRAPPQHPPLG